MEIASQRTKEEKTSQDQVDEEVSLLCIHSLGEYLGLLWNCEVFCHMFGQGLFI